MDNSDEVESIENSDGLPPPNYIDPEIALEWLRGDPGDDDESAIDWDERMANCVSIDEGAISLLGVGCFFYDLNPWYCSYTSLDTEEFNAQDMCCACGGGNY